MIALVGNNSLYTAASGLRDAQVRMNVTAHNIANMNTEGFVPGRVTSAAMAGGGVLPAIEPYSVMGEGHSQTQVAGEMVNLLLAKTAFSAASTLIRTEKDTQESLIEALG